MTPDPRHTVVTSESQCLSKMGENNWSPTQGLLLGCRDERHLVDPNLTGLFPSAASVLEASFECQVGGSGLTLPCGRSQLSREEKPGARVTAEVKILLEAAAPSRVWGFYPQETACDSREQMNQAGWLSELLWGSRFSELGRVRRSNARCCAMQTSGPKVDIT